MFASLGISRRKTKEKKMKKLLLILLSISILIIISCENPTPPDDDQEEIVLSEETVLIDETNLSEPDIDSTGTYYSYTFTGVPPDINVDDVIIGETDYGYLRKVANVEVQGNELILQTEQACLTDAIEKCSIKDSIQLTIGKNKLNGMYCTYLAKGVSVEKDGIVLDNTTLYSGNVGDVTITATIPDGYVSFEPILNTELDINFVPPRINHLLLSAGGILEYDCDLKITASSSLDYSKEVLLCTFISPPFLIGPIPCFFELSFVAGFETELDVEGTIKSGFDSEASMEIGAEYNYGVGWDEIWNKSFEFNNHPIQWGITGDVYARGYITPQITLKVAGVMGPYLEAEPYLKFDGNVTIPTSWEWELLGGVDANLGFEVEILSFSLADFNTTLASWETTIASDNGLLYYITVTSPDAGDTWQMGTSQTIKWDDNFSNNVKIDLYRSGEWKSTIKNTTESDGSYIWNIPTDLPESSLYQIKIRSVSNDNLFDYSDNFTIQEAPPSYYVTVTAPSAGDTWQMGTTQTITWDDNFSNDVKIDLYKSGGWVRTIKSSTPSNGSYTWEVPYIANSSEYKIRIKSVANDNIYDWSDYFTLDAPDHYITITSPSAGETWYMGTACNITWDANIGGNVKIDLYKSDTWVRMIENSTPSTGSYTWDIPTQIDASSEYQVRIKSVSNDNVYDWSDYFTIEEGGGTGTVTDIDGNVYQTIIFGDQEWMAENLKVTRYRNGDPIPNVTNNSTWAGLSTDAYCYYNNNTANGNTYGALYNWYAVDDTRGLAPVGWHVPTDDEIKELEMYLGMSQSQANSTGWRGTNEGSKLAGGYDLWNSGVLRNDPEFDTSGFSFIPGCYRYYYDGAFGNVGNYGNLWSSAEDGSYGAWYRYLYYGSASMYRYYGSKRNGFSVRCIRD